MEESRYFIEWWYDSPLEGKGYENITTPSLEQAESFIDYLKSPEYGIVTNLKFYKLECITK